MQDVSALRDAIALAQAIEEHRARNILYRFFPDNDDDPKYPSRHRYPKHTEFFRLGRTTFSRFAMAGNGVGKTEGMGGYEFAWHLRGEYPDWWEGIRYNRPISCWAAGKTHESTRDILQTKLFGKPYMERNGGGLIPVDWIDLDSISRMSNPAGRIDSLRIKRKDGGVSYVKLKSYDQGVDAFVGTEQDFIWLDEPPPIEIYAQCAARTRNRPDARIIITATPLEGRTETVRMFLEDEDPSRVVIRAGWADAPHLTEDDKAKIRGSQPRYLRNAVEFGDPTRQGGAVYAIDEKDILIEPFSIPRHWRWFLSMDTGFKYTAVGWFAHDLDSDIIYLVADYKAGGYDNSTGDPIDYTVHATRIRSRSKILTGMMDLPGVADAAAINLADGKKILHLYQSCGLDLMLPNKAVIAGIAAVTERMANGTFKVFNTCYSWLKEFREYSVDDQGRPIKINDHLMDMTRYGVMSGPAIAVSRADRGGEASVKRLSF
jgi:phage terminase large subunit-like protein